MNLSCRLSIISLTLLIVLATTSVFAGVPLVTSYQGRLLDGADQPLTGSYTMVFQIYDVLVGGAPLWTEDHVSVQVTDGLFSVALGATVPLSADILAPGSGGGGGGAGGFRYLQIQIAGQPPISPRTPLSAAPYSLISSRVSGDIETGSGELKIKPNSLSSSHIGLVGNDDVELLGVEAKPDSAKIKIRSHTGGGDPDFDLLRIVGGSGSNGGGMISITGDPDFDLLRMSAGKDSAKIRISGQSIGDPDFDLLRIVGGTGTGTAGASMTITGDPDFDLLRMSADHDSAKIRLGGKITGDPDFDLLRLTGGSGAAHLMMQNAPSGLGASSQTLDAACDNTNARLAIKTKGTSAKREIRHNTDSLIAESSVAADLDGDGLEDLVVSSSTDATSAKHAINTKGTGAQAGKSASLTVQATPGGSASAVLDIDDDGDSVPESEISQLLTPTTSSVAIKTKGTGADNNRTASGSTSTGVGSASTHLDIDDDGDSVPESEISQILTPTTSSVAIKTKGTGADKDRVISVASGTDDSAGVVTCGVDDDGDGISEYGVALTVKDEDGDIGSDMRCVADTDDDGVADNEASLHVTPTTSSMAINRKGTGADKNRSISSTCDDTSAIHLLATDDDGDGAVDRQISSTVDTAATEIAIDEPGAHVAMGMRKGWDGTIKGRFTVEESATRMIELNSDGDGYFASKVGIGVDVPTHRIDVSGGAYCDGTNWVNASDANSKENFQPVNGSELLDQIEQLEITRWNYKGNNQAEHIGPTAQDFKAAFGVGADDKSISTIDPSGIALAAIKALRIEAKDKTQQLSELQNKVQQLEALVEKLLSEKK